MSKNIRANDFEGVRDVAELQNSVSVSQSCIVSARSMAAAKSRALELAAAAVCNGGGKRPCGLCRHCRKTMQGIHPDVITIGLPLDDKGRPKKEILVDQIRGMISDAYIMPNEAERKVYIVENADSMNTAAQNAALKLLEEPPAGVVILLCAVNTRQLLPTVRSRCTEVSCGGAETENDGELVRLAGEYLKTAAYGPRSEQCAFCFANEGMDTLSAAAFIVCITDMLTDMLAHRIDPMGMSSSRLMELCALMSRCGEYLKVNTGVKHVFGLLAVA